MEEDDAEEGKRSFLVEVKKSFFSELSDAFNGDIFVNCLIEDYPPPVSPLFTCDCR